MKATSQLNISALDFSRIAVIGCPGSGKTTFALRLGEALRRNVVHLDKVLWGANWQMLPYDERQVIHGKIVSSDSWIIDGMWRSHLVDRLDRATLVVFLDYKRAVSFGRALKRRIKYRGKQRDDIAEGCLEKLDNYFLRYIWTFRRKVRPFILSELYARPNLGIVTLKTPKQAELFLSNLNNYLQENRAQ